MTLGLIPQRALLNDINPHAINFYQCLKRGLQTRVRMANDEQLYYSHRERFNWLISKGKHSTKQAAALFYYLNRTGYNGLCRFNSKGLFNVPFGRYAKINYTKNFSAYKAAFAGWGFSTGPFDAISLLPDDFIYADPPYDVEFRQYSSGGFEWQDQIRLAKWLSQHGGPVVLSNQATDRVLELYRSLGFNCRLLEAPRRISCNGDRTPALEVLATRNIRDTTQRKDH